MLRITRLASEDESILLKVEGRMVGDWVTEFHQVCTDFLSNNGKLSLDFSDVSYIDRQGVDVVRTLLGDRVKITGASMLVQALLAP